MPFAWMPKISLRELLVLVAFVAIAFAALLNASSVWITVLVSLTVLIGGAMLVIACIERGARQAFAIGFVALMGVYLLGVQFTRIPRDANIFPQSGAAERFVYDGTLPTTMILGELWLRIRAPYYLTITTNIPFERYEGPITDVGASGFGVQIKPPKNQPPGTTGFNLAVLPKLNTFLYIGHLLFAFLFGYLGGKFAVWVYHRRAAREAAQDTT